MAFAMTLFAFLLFAAPATATTGHPATVVPTVAAAARCTAHPQVVVEVTAFTPPSRGHASLTVSLRTDDGRTRRLGVVAVYPEKAFAPPEPRQSFGFALPPRTLGRHPRVVVALSSEDGAAAGGRAVISAARIEPAPQERC